MQIAYSWLQQYLPQPIPLFTLSNILTSIGLEVETIEKQETVPGNLEGLVVGKVTSCQPHPNADKLSLTTVDTGNGALLPIVCGAPNVAEGQKVIVATVGTMLYPINGAPFQIKKAKIRGEASEGMICAEDEIGLGKSHDGIMILPDDVAVGTPASVYFNLPEPDYTIHIGLTPNRSDANSHIGVARDVCAYQSHHDNNPWAVQYPNLTIPSVSKDLPITIEVNDEEACPRYAGLTIEGVQVGPSPGWLVQHLQAVGIRSINNIVDITNFVLHEYGQPLHVFDYNKIAGKKIRVQPLHEGTPFTTLDGTEKKLRADDLMICDAEKGMCIAGVYGGLGSGVTDDTRNLFLESAYFQPRSIRRSSMYHQLRTDAATHFEKGVDIEMVIPALKRAAQLIIDLAGGHIASEITDKYPTPWKPVQVQVAYAYVNKLCGKEFPIPTIHTILTALGCTVKTINPETFEVTVPANKTDIKQPADIAEELLRIDGLNNIVIPERLNISLTKRAAPASRRWKEKLANLLCHSGLQEIITNSITNSKYYPEDIPMVKMMNSLSSELDVLRPSMLESGLEVIAYNANRKLQDLHLFENGHIYLYKGQEQYVQEPILALWITGNIQQQQWNQTARKADIYYTKGLVQHVLEITGIKKIQETVLDGKIYWKRGKQLLAMAQQVTATTCKQFDIRQEVYYAEIYIDPLTEAARGQQISYQELPKYPAMRRDLALIIDKQITYEQVAQIVRKQQWPSLTHYELFDVFEHEKLGKDKKSLALSFTFQLKERTLTDEEVDHMMKQLIAQYQKELQALIRE